MKNSILFDSSLIAPCGMNCGLCLGYLRDKNRCEGCSSKEAAMPAYCAKCIIRNCEVIKSSDIKFCYVCEKYPCRRLKEIDKRYRTRHNMSMLENLVHIKDLGMDDFLESEKVKWTCDTCGGVICVHRGYCLSCNPKGVKNKI